MFDMSLDSLAKASSAQWRAMVVARANVDHYLGLLKHSALDDDRRMMVVELLAAELNKLPLDLDHLRFAESRMANLRSYLLTLLHDGNQAETAAHHAQELLKAFCQHSRATLDLNV